MTDAKSSRAGGFWRTVRTLLGVAVAAGLIVVLLFFLAGRFEEKLPTEVAEPGGDLIREPTTVVAVLVKKPRVESAVGTVRPIAEASVASKILARVEEVKVKAGQIVNQGDVLIKLDDADLQSKLRQAEAAGASAQARLDQARIDVRRSRELRKAESITQSELDLAETALKTATAESDRAVER